MNEAIFEKAFLAGLEAVGWTHTFGAELRRDKREVLLFEDFKNFLVKSVNLSEDELNALFDKLRFVGAQSDFATLHKVYGWMVEGVNFSVQNENKNIALIDFENPSANIFRAVSQFEVEYNNNGIKKTRRPDIVLFVNGVPLCIIELKNPASEKATIYDAWEQINVRYWRDISGLLHYATLACISDGVKTRLGTVKAGYEHFYSWRRVNEGDKIAANSQDELEMMIKGVYECGRFLEIFRDYVYFQDSRFDNEERQVVCRYPQFFATKLLKQSIIKAIKSKSGKGGTYFGATGCGKTYTMAFLARQLALRCGEEIGSPTIILIVDREDLQNQGAKLFTKSENFLCLGEVSVIESRAHLRQELGLRRSGGFYICTIQKFCDRQNDKIGLINDRANIVCFSDEAHRTQIERANRIKYSKDDNENMKAMLSKPYAKVLKEAFPNASFVGFTGTPISETYQTFGAQIDAYTMDQAVQDGITVPIKYHPRIAKVLLDKQKVQDIENYYKQCAEDGASFEDVEASKKAMSSMEVILGEPLRLKRLARDIYEHYTNACDNEPERVQKAMITCANRKIAFSLLDKFKEICPEWFVLKKTKDDKKFSKEELARLKPMPFIAMVASVGSNDEAKMYDYLGGVKNDERSQELATAFKDDKSNLHIGIVVDMWITGFDAPSLTFLYNDKPLKKHLLIQTISRVNRRFGSKEYGMIIDYIGIRENMREALKMYGGGANIAPTPDDVEQAVMAFRDELGALKNLFSEYDLTPFLRTDSDNERYKLLAEAAEFVFKSTQMLNFGDKKGSKKLSFKSYFLGLVKRMRMAYDLAQPSGVLKDSESALAQCFMAIAGFVRKMSGTSEVDAQTMNRAVAKMVEEALKYNEVEGILQKGGEEEELFSPEFIEKLSDIKMPATKLELLVKTLRKQIKEYGKTNQIAAKTFQELLEKTIEAYHERRKRLSSEEAGEAQELTAEEIIKAATEQALKILGELKEDKEKFIILGLTFEEKAFYDILMALRDKYNFEYGEDRLIKGVIVNEKCKNLARKIKNIIDTESKYADWLNNQNVRNNLKIDIKVCLIKNSYPPEYSPEVFKQVMQQVENFKENNGE